MAIQRPAQKQSRFLLTRNAGGVNVLVTRVRVAPRQDVRTLPARDDTTPQRETPDERSAQ
jgi:hypothetical protein